MGEIAEGVISGLFCERCYTLVDGEEPGYPRYCEDCQLDVEEERREAEEDHKKEPRI